MDINGRLLLHSDPPYVIAEAGVNHTDDIDRVVALVDVAAAAGAEAVKFQTSGADRLVTPDAPVVPHQREQTQASILRRLKVSAVDHERLIDA